VKNAVSLLAVVAAAVWVLLGLAPGIVAGVVASLAAGILVYGSSGRKRPARRVGGSVLVGLVLTPILVCVFFFLFATLRCVIEQDCLR
jgi:hypothetical protein